MITFERLVLTLSAGDIDRGYIIFEDAKLPLAVGCVAGDKIHMPVPKGRYAMETVEDDANGAN